MIAKPPTILQVIPRLDTGGAELATIEVTSGLVAAGARAIVVTEGGRLTDKVVAAGGEIVTLPVASKNPLTIYRNAGQLARLVEREDVRLLHARSRAPAWSALIAARRTGRPFVTTYHGAYSEKGALKRLYNSVMARSDVVIANSRFTANLIRQRYGTAEERIAIIYRGVDPNAFSPAVVAQKRVAALRERWGIRPEIRIVLNAARLTSWKGQRVLIDAAASLNRHGKLEDVVIVLAGDAQGRSGYEQELYAQIANHGLGGCVKIVGHVEDMPAAFLASHAAVVASTEPEAFGRAAAEAQAMGCPIIATRIGAPQETVLAAPEFGPDMRTGWLVPPNDSQALAAALAEVLALSADERAGVGERAVAHVNASYTLERMIRDTLGVYDRLLQTTLRQQL